MKDITRECLIFNEVSSVGLELGMFTLDGLDVLDGLDGLDVLNVREIVVKGAEQRQCKCAAK